MNTDGCNQVFEADAFRRRFTFPEEERRQLTTAPASGVRWFKSNNVVDLEAYRRKREVCEHVGLRG